MVLRMILRYLASNENLINKLAESRPIRRAAQLCVYVIHKTNNLNIPYRYTDNPKELASLIVAIVKRFSVNLKKELEEAKRQLQEKKPK